MLQAAEQTARTNDDNGSGAAEETVYAPDSPGAAGANSNEVPACAKRPSF